jgi:flagellar basal-body rod protein FlgF
MFIADGVGSNHCRSLNGDGGWDPMDSAGYILLSRLTVQQRATDVIAHNIANADTPGFRGSQSLFSSYLSRAGGSAPAGPAHFVDNSATWRNMAAAPLRATGNPLDLALPGDGFFVVQTPRGDRYTRAGHFGLSPDGTVVDTEGNPLLGEDGPIQIQPDSREIMIAGDGTIRTENGNVGRIRVVRFEDPQQLVAEGSRLFSAPPRLVPEGVRQIGIVQGSVEGSNVRPVTEMVRMMAELREFQFAAQFSEREGERVSNAVDRLLRRR